MAGNTKGSSTSTQAYANPHESLSGLARFFLNGAKEQTKLSKVPGDALRALVGTETQSSTPQKGDLAPGEVLNLGKKKNKTETKPAPHIEAGIDHRQEVVHGTEMIRRGEATQIDRRLEELRSEIARLAFSIQAVSREAKSISVEQAPKEAGKYHATFLEWMLSVVRAARMQVEDSGAWMAVSKKKNSFQQKSQSLGSKFSLSSERSTATQTG